MRVTDHFAFTEAVASLLKTDLMAPPSPTPSRSASELHAKLPGQQPVVTAEAGTNKGANRKKQRRGAAFVDEAAKSKKKEKEEAVDCIQPMTISFLDMLNATAASRLPVKEATKPAALASVPDKAEVEGGEMPSDGTVGAVAVAKEETEEARVDLLDGLPWEVALSTRALRALESLSPEQRKTAINKLVFLARGNRSPTTAKVLEGSAEGLILLETYLLHGTVTLWLDFA